MILIFFLNLKFGIFYVVSFDLFGISNTKSIVFIFLVFIIFQNQFQEIKKA